MLFWYGLGAALLVYTIAIGGFMLWVKFFAKDDPNFPMSGE